MNSRTTSKPPKKRSQARSTCYIDTSAVREESMHRNEGREGTPLLTRGGSLHSTLQCVKKSGCSGSYMKGKANQNWRMGAREQRARRSIRWNLKVTDHPSLRLGESSRASVIDTIKHSET